MSTPPVEFEVASRELRSKASEPREAFDAMFREAHTRGAIHGTVLITENGQVVYQGHFGLADHENEEPITSESIFPIASVTKPIVATAIQILDQEGKLRLNDPAQKYLPTFPYSNVTIRHLLSHSAGLPDSSDFFLDSWGKEKIADNKALLNALRAANATLVTEPGAKFGYSNLGYMVLAEVIAAASEQSYRDFVRGRVFKPAKMESARFAARPDEPRKHRSVVTYVQEAGKWVDDRKSVDFRFLFWLGGTQGDGDIELAPTDLVAFDTALRSGTLLAHDAIDAATKPLVLENGEEFWQTSWSKQSYGLGWWIPEGQDSVLHTGDWGGSLAYYRRYPDKGRVAIVLQNHRSTDYSWVAELEALMSAPWESSTTP